MNWKEYEYNKFYGCLNTYRDSDELVLQEKVRQSAKINMLIANQIAEEQIKQADMFSELHNKELSQSFCEGFVLGKEYVVQALEPLLLELLDEEEICLTLHGGAVPVLSFSDEDLDQEEPKPQLELVLNNGNDPEAAP